MRFIFVFLFCGSIWCDSAFRFGTVLSSTGRTDVTVDARNGYELYFEKVNSEHEGRGFYLEGKPGTTGFHFRYSFLWRDDANDQDIHAASVSKLIKEDKVHFLGGSHEMYAKEEMQLADQSGILNYHCCVEPDVFYDNFYRTVLGITASNKEYTKNFVRSLLLSSVGAVAIIYEEDDILMRTTCEAAIAYVDESKSFSRYDDKRSIYKLNHATSTPQYFKDVAKEMKNTSIDAVVACVYPEEGKQLVNAFHDIQYPLKSFFLTMGPTYQTWVDSFEPHFRANDLYSAAQWHQDMKYRDSFFGSSLEYSEIYQDRFERKLPTPVAAAASAVGLTLTQAIRNAFRFCDISKTGGDVDILLYNASAIVCDDGQDRRGYDRVVHALWNLDMETFFGRVKFNFFGRNVGLEPVTTQVFENILLTGEVSRIIQPVLPVQYATAFPKFPAENYYREECQKGYFVGSDAFDPCRPCDRGTWSDMINAPHCDSCPLGEWNDSPAQSKCQSCPEGTQTLSRGAKLRTECVCKTGYYSDKGLEGEKCKPCPEGAVCNGGTSPPKPVYGYWTQAGHRGQVYPCDPASVCIGEDDSACAAGYTGRLCSECESGYFSVIQKCYKCFNSGLIVLLSMSLLVGWYVINVIVSRSVASMEMILVWAQLANIIGDINLNWTGRVTTLFGVANILDFDVDILEPSCLFYWGYRQNFIVQLCLPFIMSFLAASGYFSAFIAYNVLIKRELIQIDSRRREILSIFVDVPKDEEHLVRKWDATIATFLASVDITYVTIVKYCFDVFKCEDIAGVRVLRVDPSVECNEHSDHDGLVVLAAMGIIFFVVGYPAYMSWKLYDLSCRSAFSSPRNLRRYGFIYEKYELNYSFTPAIVLARKLLFVLVLVYVNNPAFQAGTLALLSIVSLMIHVYTAPYVDTYLDVLFSVLLVALMCEAFGGLMFYSENLPEADRQVLEWIVIATVIVLTIVFAAILFMEIVKKYHIRYLKKEHRRFANKSSGPVNSFFSIVTSPTPLKSLSSSLKVPEKVSYELLDTFNPRFVHDSIRSQPELIQKWDKLTMMLKDYMSDQSETSYLSMDPIAKFWRKLVDRFPELIDFLAVADDATRDKFNDFATNLYRNFYLSNKVAPLPLMDILNWRDYAPMAQWLAIAPSADREFFVSFISEMYRATGNEDAADMLQSRIRHGGPDPELEERKAATVLSKKKRRILHSLRSGSHPFQHSAAVSPLKTVSKLSIGLSRLRARYSKGRSPPAADEEEAFRRSIRHDGFVRLEAVTLASPMTRCSTTPPRLLPSTSNASFPIKSQGIEMTKSVTFATPEVDENLGD